MSATRRARRGLTFETMMTIERLSEPAVSPDGRRVAYVTSTPDLPANTIRRTIRLLDLESGAQRELTPGPGNHYAPAWSPDGTRLALVSDRDPQQGEQLWILPRAGGEARRLTAGYGGVSQPIWAPDGRRLAFCRQVVEGNDDRRRRRRETVDPRSGPPTARVYGLAHQRSSAQIADGLLFRHWDRWRDRRRRHVFIADSRSGRLRDLTPFPIDAPPIALGSTQDIVFSPDGRELAYVMNPDAVVARSTNNCIFLQALDGLRPLGEPRCISTTEACDCHPRYGAGGARLYYLGMEVPGYEADRRRIKVFERAAGTTRVLTERLDRSPASFVVRRRGGREEIVFLAADRGRQSLYRLDPERGRVRQLTAGSFNGSLRAIPGSDDLLVTRASLSAPADLHRLTPGAGVRPLAAPGAPDADARAAADGDAGSRAVRLTRHGDAARGVAMHAGEEFWCAGAADHPVHGFLLKPPGFSSRRTYPLVLLIHGGPQSAFMDDFHYRWNPQLFAAAGAVVAMVNPRGSIGYGQRFTDQISRDWGGRCYEDLMRALDQLLARYPFIDPERLGAAGASFGGFMVNWIAGHSDRFKALVSHDGIFCAETMAYTTDELWFDAYEHGGLPHENRRAYLKHSPHLHVARFQTPTLVIQGGRDYRCPVSEGLGMFTALQVRGVPSRLLHFPDEGHWVLGVANAQVWYAEVVGWLMRYLS